ncbi:MAG: Asp-tRNA(Asn)/Glu-tRNA(Gln) amidotransferase subunit GatB [Candidatus Aadella gelida]|nr:Asp-tRNA(Asn)/Glu-tRNA(Gln) amidotransferase subunit GatB [Candidatus Aadella gelida]
MKNKQSRTHDKTYETVIGLEVHVQLSTKTKIFCGCSTVFGAEPNTQVCPVCLGLPGVLPVLNRKAFEYSIKVALALGCDIQEKVKFDRKNYYYPDLPKNYQISQYDMPIAYNGKICVVLEDGTAKDIGITRAHMEEDAGKLLHDPVKDHSYVDLNRTGTPLLEIVSEPELTSPEEAYSYLVTLKRIVKYLGVADCNMEEGSLRCDANISIRKWGADKLGTKVEIKNLNSFKAVRNALAFEEYRQRDLVDSGEKIIQETRLWDEPRGKTESMRVKEQAHDYRYFPDPDLVPFEVEESLINEIRSVMPESPSSRKSRFIEKLKLNDKDADFLTSEKYIADFFESVLKSYNDPQSVCNWVKGEVMMHSKEKGTDIDKMELSPENLAIIIKMTKDGKISALAAKEVLADHLDGGKSPEKIVKEKGLEQVSDTSELDGIIDEVILENERSVNDYKAGKKNALSFLVGQVMKKSQGKANPKLAGEMLIKRIT